MLIIENPERRNGMDKIVHNKLQPVGKGKPGAENIDVDVAAFTKKIRFFGQSYEMAIPASWCVMKLEKPECIMLSAKGNIEKGEYFISVVRVADYPAPADVCNNYGYMDTEYPRNSIRINGFQGIQTVYETDFENRETLVTCLRKKDDVFVIRAETTDESRTREELLEKLQKITASFNKVKL
jgi:hypothetical protein